ncbi:reverse transcriptase [Elysia marginata]|uniref:ribonuclease H n=1 Tax=Elysia marginata TaxID=1093978 RepID=A0AAV4H1D8_9GAST|nr:reverse transcriptase [Elysia marginata]
MTGGIKSTPINSMESVTGLESFEDRRKKKIVCQYTKFQHLANHPMCKLITTNPRKRLKRTNFTASAQQIHKSLELPDLKPDTPLQSSIDWPPWNQQSQIEIVKDIDGVTSKKSMIKRELHCLTRNMLDKKYPSYYWIRAFTDGSASEAVRDGGGGVYIEWPDNSSSKISIPTGKYSTNYKAEAEALQEAAKVLVNSEATHHAKVVLLTDARSVLDALESAKCPEVNALAQAITTLSLTASKLVLQWIPGQVDIFGNDVADQLAKEGSMIEQIQHNPSYNEAKTLINSALDCQWRQEHPQHNSKDAIHKLSRAEQVTIFRLRTGHNRLKHHLFSRFRIGDGPNCPCGANRQDAQHVLQDCPQLDDARLKYWPEPREMNQKLYGSALQLGITAEFIYASDLTI